MRDADFARLQTVLVDNVLFRREHEPYGFVVQRGIFGFGVGIIVTDQCLLSRGCFPLGLL